MVTGRSYVNAATSGQFAFLRVRHRRGSVPTNDGGEHPGALFTRVKDGYPIRDEDVAWLSPLLYHYINMLGRYSFEVPEAAIRGERRPLHNPADDEAYPSFRSGQ
jgi:hypothetical protein